VTPAITATTVVTVALLLGACGPSAESAAPAQHASSTPPPPTAHLTTDVHDAWPGTSPVTVSTDRGRLSQVDLTAQNGRAIAGHLAVDGRTWTSTSELPPTTTYSLTARVSGTSAVGAATLTKTFTTGAPAAAFTVDVTPWGQQVVGIGQPIIVRTNRTVTSAPQRQDTEAALQVKVNGQPATGAWHWVSGTELHYREQGFWPANSQITVTVGLHDVHLATGVWGTGDRVVSFRTGRSLVMNIDDSTHQMTVTRNGTLVRTIPVSMGRPGYETRSGIKTIMSHERTVRMTSSSYGGADYYDEIVHDAERLTNSGEYIHSAPWSVGDQGYRNVSHGCVNVSPENAAWLFTNTLIGDPVITSGTSRGMEPGNGTGADWDIPWSSWANAAGS
jgi:lipoprotein-anchoring transpeptidase ErfK/SrfK